MDSAAASSWVEVDLGALRHNVGVLRRVAGGAQLAAVVKADAYGHGAAPIARAAIDAGATRLCVFALSEAVALREAGLSAPILVLGPLPRDRIEQAVSLDLTVSLSGLEEAGELARVARAAGRRAAVHINVDGGMQRLGLSGDAAIRARRRGARARFAVARGRLHALSRCLCRRRGVNPLRVRALSADRNAVGAPLRHAAASAALLRFPEMALELVRPGIALYGAGPLPGEAAADLRPVLSWRASLLLVRDVPAGESVSYGGRWTARRDSRIGVIGVGYADGLRRALWDRAEVLIRGRRAPIAGTICMDLTMIDLTDVPAARAGDRVTLIGRDGRNRSSPRSWQSAPARSPTRRSRASPRAFPVSTHEAPRLVWAGECS